MLQYNLSIHIPLEALHRPAQFQELSEWALGCPCTGRLPSAERVVVELVCRSDEIIKVVDLSGT